MQIAYQSPVKSQTYIRRECFIDYESGLALASSLLRLILCLCESSLDEFGDHLLGCDQKTNLVIKRHNALCDTLFHTLHVDDFRCRREQRCNTTSNSKPCDIFQPDFQRGLPSHFDVSVRNSLQPSYLIQAANCAGAAAEAGVLEKDRRHEDMVKAVGSLFEPLVVETLGLWHPHSMRMLKIIVRKTAFHCCQTVSRTLMFLYKQLSVKFWLFNARLILERLALNSRGTVVGNTLGCQRSW